MHDVDARRSSVWSLCGQFANLSIGLCSLAVLARLVPPADFGTVGILLAFQALFVPMLDLGLTQAYLKVDEVGPNTQNCFYTLNVFLGVSNFGIMVLCAPILAIIYGEPVLVPMAIAYAVSTMIGSFNQQAMAGMARTHRFDKIVGVNLSGLIASLVVSLSMAWFGYGGWALLARVAVEPVAKLGVTRLVFCRQSFQLVHPRTLLCLRDSIRYGVGIVGSRLVNGIGLSLDRLLLGVLLPTNILGQYMKASDLAIMPDRNIRTALASPALSHLARHDRDALPRQYLLITRRILLIAGFPCTLLIVAGDWLVLFLLGSQWELAGLYVRAMGVWGIGKIMHGILEIVLLNERRVRRLLTATAIAFMVVPLCLLPALLLEDPMYFILPYAGLSLCYWTAVLSLSLHGCGISLREMLSKFAFPGLLLVLSTGSGAAMRHATVALYKLPTYISMMLVVVSTGLPVIICLVLWWRVSMENHR